MEVVAQISKASNFDNKIVKKETNGETVVLFHAIMA